MSRLLITAAVIVVAVTIFAVVDCAMTDAKRTRALPKPVWVVVVLLVPVVGPLLWLFFGKVRGNATAVKPVQTTPDDDETFLKSIGIESDSEERIRKLEEELKALDDVEFPAVAPKGPVTEGGAATALEDAADEPVKGERASKADKTEKPAKPELGGKKPRKGDAGDAGHDGEPIEHKDDWTQGDGSSRA
ncbi:ribosomal protein L12E/L44/L45/RPP1/RPP2 [Pseudoclavibacter sp. JAI123]|uniref:PLDc N-terminal domain-containing protein n=1 Tax=Pseudoclavibacter sp. JAI123 TaxID=2723065 RepID=UPI0015C7994B|nr:PLDc N-terminal domain-containing protein [Pseudoclavibacter sp. JAI123]NYF11766.1 ribosomal protein L12E/L44/L45/RPP1/RPP2 [Pseudoclavibacter sp. JAI123]